MSIANEISRLQTAKADLKTAIEGKGVTVPSSTKLDGYADLVDSIETGGGDNTGEWTYIKCNTSVNGTNPNVKAGSKFYIQYTNSSNLIVEFISTVNYTTRTWGSNKLVSREPTLLEDYDTWYRIKPNNMNVGDIGTLTITQSAGTVIYTFKLIKTFSETAELDVMATDYDADIEKLNVSGGGTMYTYICLGGKSDKLRTSEVSHLEGAQMWWAPSQKWGSVANMPDPDSQYYYRFTGGYLDNSNNHTIHGMCVGDEDDTKIFEFYGTTQK